MLRLARDADLGHSAAGSSAFAHRGRKTARTELLRTATGRYRAFFELLTKV
jgi:hypothetical protein